MQKLIPPFLKKLDHYLLLNYRLLWVSKVHYVLFYGITAVLVGSAFIYTYPLYLSTPVPKINSVFLISMGLVAPALAYWVYWQAIHSLSHRQEAYFKGFAQARFLVQMLCFCIFFGVAVSWTALVEQRLKGKIDIETIAKDANTLNLGNPYIPTTLEDDTLWHDTELIVEVSTYKDDIYVSNDTSFFYAMGKDTLLRQKYHYDFELFRSYYSERDDSWHYGGKLRRLEKLFFDKKPEKELLALTENYIEVFNKYSKNKIHLSAKEILKNYLEKKVVLPRNIAEEKEYVRYQLSKWSRIQEKSIFDDGLYKTPISLFFIFLASVLLFTFQYVRLDYFFIGLTATILGAAGIVFFADIARQEFIPESVNHIYRRVDTIIAFLCGLLFIGLLGISTRNYFFSKTSNKLKNIFLVITSLSGFPVVLLFILGTSVIHREIYGYDYGKNAGMYFCTFVSTSMLAYFLFLVPMLHAFFAKMRSLPKS